MIMGLCVSSHITRRGGNGIFLNLPSAVQVIHWNGRLQELWQPTKAGEIQFQNPNFFLCSSETMNVNSVPRQMAKDEPLQLGQLYFLVPIAKINAPFSLQDLCTLAVKASKALKHDSDEGRRITLQTSIILPDGSSGVVRYYAGSGRGEGSCEVPNKAVMHGSVRMDSLTICGLNQGFAL